jgi:trehalose-phosphatase
VKPWRTILALVATRPHLHVFCDFDGTIVPVHADPAETVISARARVALERLQARPRTEVALVSGRPAATLAEKVCLPDLTLAGNHGMEIVSRAGRREDELATRARPAVARLGDEIERHLLELDAAEAPGLVLEKKEISLTLHTKLVSEATHQALAERLTALTAREPLLEIHGGKRVLEIRPRGAANKGHAILGLLEAAHGAGWSRECAAVFLGDDLTDEDGFAAIGRDGAGVLVGAPHPPRATHARYHAADVDDAICFLEALAVAPSAQPGREHQA